ncbi:Mitochondrial import inner membrane translocase subunit Tim21 [Mactra antiquata]
MALRLASSLAIKGKVRNLVGMQQLFIGHKNVKTILIVGFHTNRANYQQMKEKDENTGKELDVARENPYAGMTMGEKVKEAGKDFTYLAVSVAALGVLGALFYYIGRELFSSQSSVGVYKKALKRCVEDSEVIIALGQPIKGYGEETRRGRRRHVSHIEFVQDGRKHMRMKFYVEGTDKKGEVNLEVVQNDDGKYDFRYLFIQLEQFPYKTIVLEDNR